MTETDVLISGAGPTGLVLALWLSKLNIKVRIIDKAEQLATSTRAIAVQSRTLELYDQLDPELTKNMIEMAHQLEAFNIWMNDSWVVRLPIAEAGAGLTPHPTAALISQHEHEKLLRNRLRDRFGVSVELQTELMEFFEDDESGRIKARVHTSSGQETIYAKFIAGCDGAHSAVRKTLDIPFSGGTYEQVFYVADVNATGRLMDGEAHVHLESSDVVAVFPLPGGNRARLIGTVQHDKIPVDARSASRNLNFEDVSSSALERTNLTVDRVNWFSSYRVHHRVADSFHRGRAFLLGDAAHVHSPVGGQGMNTGIGDAVNLAWKLAAVVKGEAGMNLLETYGEERRNFANKLVHTTDGAFTLITKEGWLAQFVRAWIIPLVAPIVTSFRSVQRAVYKTGAQFSLHYRDMTLSSGRVGGIQGGDRLPWVFTDGVSNFESLCTKWQIHVYGKANDVLIRWCKKHEVPLSEYPWRMELASSGLVRDAVYVLRPDSYVALVDKGADPRVIEIYFANRQIRLPA
ncbi:hypothetical protein QQS21_001314 [Conoideocrella luteorostrata]|uniref:FAD-binding domain-containing protein n=1 Tax=Conoideocrella luteorostrata TaxID=1105319 RepID=A0AAJ0D0T9_9HYPO|nr:hypothetical protein QQS21_001314 [Conoideocrella luteorostrata]